MVKRCEIFGCIQAYILNMDFDIIIEISRKIADPVWLYVLGRGVAWWQNANWTLLSYIMGAQLATSTKAELPQEGILFCTQFPSLGIFVNKKVGFLKN